MIRLGYPPVVRHAIPQPPPEATCARCSSSKHLVVGDGELVCRPCIDLLGGAARDPEHAPDDLLGLLLELHDDVIDLVREDEVLAWLWIAPWPRAGEREAQQ